MEEINASITQAAREGDALQLRRLLKHTPHYNIRKHVLSLVLRHMRHIDGHKYEQCVKVLLEETPRHRIPELLNVRDENGKSPLSICGDCERDMQIDFPGSYTCNYEAVTNMLLKAGASFADTDDKGEHVIASFRYDRLARFFDTCITREDFATVRFDFTNLLPLDFKTNPRADVLGILLFIRKNYTLRRLLKHPLISMFFIYISHMKWRQMRGVYFTNLIFYFIFYLTVLLQVVNCNTRGSLVLTTSLLAARETFQLIISPRRYFKNLENYLEILMIILITTAFCVQEKDVNKQLLVFTFLSATFEFLFLLGRHMILMKYVLMFKTVLRNFLKLSIFIAIITVAFAISFNILFNTDDLFSNPLTSIFRTVVMATGEYDSDDLKFTDYPIGSHVILLLFVIIVSIVLMNLIMGLAISDIQRLEKHSLLYGFLATTEFLHHVEHIAYHPKTRWFFEFLGRRVHRRLNVLDAILPDNRDVEQVFSIDMRTKWYSFVSAIALQDDDAQIKDALSRLRNLAEKINAKVAGDAQMRED